MRFAEVARLAGGELQGPPQGVVRGVAPLETAGPDHLSFVASAQYLPYLPASQAALVLLPSGLAGQAPEGRSMVLVADPHRALAEVLPRLYPEPPVAAGVHPAATVHPEAHLGDNVAVGPFAVVESGVELAVGVRIGAHAWVGAGAAVGEGSTIHPHATIGPGVTIGARCVVYSGARIGSDGFGYVWADGRHLRVPQVGGCRLEDDVEIGANSTIDRGSVGDTVIGRGTKIDNLVHVGHNVQIGEHAIVIAQVGISGSTTVGDGAILGGQAGFAGHLRIGAGARVGAQAGVISDVEPGSTVSGYPARPHREALRAQASLFRLPRLLERLRALEERVLGTSP